MEEFDIDRLKDYLNNRLSEEERNSFEGRLVSDPEFKKQFEIHKSLLEGIDYHFDNKIKQSFKDREAKLKKRKLPVIMPIAASLLIVAIVAYQVLITNPSHGDIYSKYYKPYYNVVDDPQRNAPPPDSVSAFQLYDKGEYREAIATLRKASSINTHERSFYLGLSYLAVNESDSAIFYLDESHRGASVFSEPAQWYLGLTYLKTGKTEMARDVFREIANGTGSYRDRAESILEDL